MSNEYFGFDDSIFSSTQKIKFATFKNGEHRFRVLPPFAQGKLYQQVDLHWGFTDENNKKKALKCTKYEFKTCAICDEADKAKADADMIAKNPQGFASSEELKMAFDEKMKRHGDLKKKASYLWNIMADDGVPSVLQLSWNGHEQLFNKVKFLWEQSKINVSDINNSVQLWCSRTGQGVMTRYQFETIANSNRKLENIGQLVDLSKVYKETTPSELKQIVERGYISQTQEDPNDRDFKAPPANNMKDIPAYQAPAAQAQPAAQQVVQVQPQEAVAPSYQAQFDQATTPQPNPAVNNAVVPNTPVNNVNVDDEITKMQNLLGQR